MMDQTSRDPWHRILDLLDSGDHGALISCLDDLGPRETARAISRLDAAERGRLLALLDPPEVAEVFREVQPAQAVDLVESLSPDQAAAVMGEMPSDKQTALLSELDEEDAEAILGEMPAAQADEARRHLSYPEGSAGRLMIGEYVAYRQDLLVRDILDDLRANRAKYSGYPLQYLYVLDRRGKLAGVLRLRDLVFEASTSSLEDVMIRNPSRVRAGDRLPTLTAFFGQHRLLGAPVVDEEDRLVGVILSEAVEHAREDRAVHNFLGISGILGGEEIRSMPLRLRSQRRLSWLSINIVLNVVAASVIAAYQDTLQAAIALAVFLPIISDMSGCAGNQAVAVSIRELSLGLVRPRELLRVFRKELGVGVINGAVLGLLLAGAAQIWKGNPWLGLVVGAALALNTALAATLGGLLPLIMRRFRVDPALVSGPVLTTVTDMCGFFIVLSMGTQFLPMLAG